MIKQRFEVDQIMTSSEEIIDSLKQYQGSCDEIWLFLERGLNLDLLKEQLKVVEKFANQARALGIKISVETAPLGHGGKRKGVSCEDYSIDATGKIQFGQYCWRSEQYRKEKVATLSLIAKKLKPYTFYFDDDLRIRNWGGALACFCDNCIAKFNKQYHAQYTREELVSKVEKDIKVRKQYLEFCYDGISEFCYVLTKEIIKNSPETHMGVEHGEYSGECFLRCIATMHEASGKTVRSRSGAGSYSDYYPTALLDKTFETQYQLSRLPDYVDEYCNEVENFPSTYYSKTGYGTCLEISLHLASGFNCTSIKCWKDDFKDGGLNGEFELFTDCLKECAKRRTYWEALVNCNNAGGKKSGLQIFIPKNYLNELDKNWMFAPSFYGRYYNRYGIPLTFSKTKGGAYFLDEKFSKTISEKELQVLLSSPVATSGAAIAVLVERGFGKYFSVTSKRLNSQCYKEEFTVHQLNGEFKKFTWGQSLFARKNYALTALDDSIEVLSTLRQDEYFQTEDDDVDGKIAAAIITTKLGGKWFIQGYNSDDDTYPWAKRQQINEAIRYITGGLLVEHTSRNRLMLFPIENNNGELLNVSMLNPTIAHQNNIELIVRGIGNRKAYLMNEFGKKKPVKMLKTMDGVKVFIKEIKAWSVQTLFFD